jgi:hypothetical protein
MKSYRYRKKMNRHWSVSTPRHRSEDDKRQSAKNELWLMIYSFEPHRSFLLVMKSEIIFRDFPYIWLRFLPLSVYSRCLQSESELNSSDLFFWISFQSNSCRFAVRAIFILASRQILATPDFCKSPNSCKIAPQSEQSRSPHISQAVKSLQWRQILNHS